MRVPDGVPCVPLPVAVVVEDMAWKIVRDFHSCILIYLAEDFPCLHEKIGRIVDIFSVENGSAEPARELAEQGIIETEFCFFQNALTLLLLSLVIKPLSFFVGSLWQSAHRALLKMTGLKFCLDKLKFHSILRKSRFS